MPFVVLRVPFMAVCSISVRTTSFPGSLPSSVLSFKENFRGLLIEVRNVQCEGHKFPGNRIAFLWVIVILFLPWIPCLCGSSGSKGSTWAMIEF